MNLLEPVALLEAIASEIEDNVPRVFSPPLLLLFSGGGRDVKKNFQSRFPGTMRTEKPLLYWDKGQRYTSTEANQTTADSLSAGSLDHDIQRHQHDPDDGG